MDEVKHIFRPTDDRRAEDEQGEEPRTPTLRPTAAEEDPSTQSTLQTPLPQATPQDTPEARGRAETPETGARERSRSRDREDGGPSETDTAERMDLNFANLEGKPCQVIEVELCSNRDVKRFTANAAVFMAHKVRSSEVTYRNLNAEDKELFDEGKAREISDWLARSAFEICRII